MKLSLKIVALALLFAFCGVSVHGAQQGSLGQQGQKPPVPAPGEMVRTQAPDDVLPRPSGGVPDALRVLLTPEQMREDVAAWKAGLEELCAGLYRYVTEEQFEALFEDLDARLENDLPLLVFYRELMRTCMHLRHQRVVIVMPADMTSRTFGKQSNVLPLSVHIEGDRVFVVDNLGGRSDVPVGSELLEIETVPVSALLQTMYNLVPAEGYSTSSKPKRIERGLPLYYLLLIDETLPEYDVAFRTPEGEELTRTLPGVLGTEAFELARPNAGQDLLEIEILDERKTAILAVRSLYERDLTSGGWDFETFVEAVFVELAEKGIEHLVLDLRGNERGSDVHGVKLVSHLVAEPFRYFNYVKTAPTYNGNQDVAERSDGQMVLFPYAGMGAQKPHAERYLGDLIVLIDGGTFGTAADVAAVLHRLGRATFVGEPTGGVYDGSTVGTAEKVVLPNSQLAADIPILDFELHGGSPDLFGLGVPPDHTVVWTAADRLAGKDTVREFVLRTLLDQ